MLSMQYINAVKNKSCNSFSEYSDCNNTLFKKDFDLINTETHVPINVLMSFIGSPTLGEHFNPAKDCSDIVDNLPEATDGFYWIKPTKGKLSKVKIIKNSQKRY